MYYSLISLLALFVLLITNHDVLLRRHIRHTDKVARVYRWFLLAVIFYYLSDISWGALEAYNLTGLLYLDTEVYFAAMSLGVLFWTQYVVAYLEDKDTTGTILRYAGVLYFVVVMAITVGNFFAPIMFWFDEAGKYHTAIGRNVALVLQIIILLLTVFFVFRAARYTENSVRYRYVAVGFSGVVMLLFIAYQITQPYLPLYAIGYMLGNCLLRTFVIEGERQEYRANLETALDREREQLKELNEAWQLAYTDALTGAKSKLAYLEKEEEIDRAIAKGTANGFAVVVFDVNNLKIINDTMGHEVGDRYIVDAYSLISDTFKDCPVFRIGGDEFVALIEEENLPHKEAMLDLFNQRVKDNGRIHKVMVSAGVAEYMPGNDNSYNRIFERADRQMYARKMELKQQAS